MRRATLPENIQEVCGLFYSPTSQNLSGQMAIAFALVSIADRKKFKRKSRSSKRPENTNWLAAAQELSSQIGVQDQMSLDDFELVLDLYPDRRIVVYSSRTNQPAPGGIFKGPDYNPEMAEEKTLWIYHDQENDHYSFIENMQAYSRSFNAYRGHQFCAKCCGWVPKRALHTHRCVYEFRCFDCGNHELNSSGDLMYHRNKKVHGTRSCGQCGKDMTGGLCIQHHESWCNSNNLEWLTCESCSKKYAVNWTHVCYHLWCNKCSKHYPEQDQHRCFISKDKHRRPLDASTVSTQTTLLPESDSDLNSVEEDDDEVVDKKLENRFIDVEARQSKRPRMIQGSRHYAYDIESMLTSVSQADGTSKDRHDVTLIVVRRLYCESEDDDSYWVFRSINTFFEFALKKKRSYFWAHNAKGYDSQLLFSYITHHSTSYQPKNIIFRGEKLLQFCVNTNKFRDSMCHLASALDSLPKMLGFSGNWKKGFFPHKFNTTENQEYVGPMPDRSFFEPDEMKPDRRAAFDKWYKEESETNTIWDFQENLVAYCKADVMVLARALEKYDSLMKDLNCGVSPLTNITLASYALTVFRNLHMPEDCLVVATEDEHRFAAEALHGGKTDVRILHREWIKEQIDRGIYGCYVDVQSMYPYVQYTREMPCGVPTWRTFDEVDLDFLQSFIGFAKCDIHPTKYLHHPVIGGKDPNSGKYVFDLRPKKGIILTSAEIQTALRNGYVVTHLSKALVFPQQQILFKSYIQTFLKIKLEASGMPKDIDWETFSTRHQEELGIDLDPSKLERNDGLRSMSKLMLNSLWGKLGQDPNLPHTVTLNSDIDYQDYVRKEHRGHIEIKQTQQLSDERTIVQFVKNDELTDLENKNVAVAAFVAAYGRLYLWETLNKLGDRVLYHDTDSVVYEHIPEGPNVEIGYMLGDWENELDEDDCMTSFVALGPKTYSYQTLKGKGSIKCKGFTLTAANRETLTHQSMIQLVQDSRQNAQTSITLSDRVFKWDRKKGEYWTHLTSKTMRFTADKNVIDWDKLTTMPFGHELFR